VDNDPKAEGLPQLHKRGFLQDPRSFQLLLGLHCIQEDIGQLGA